MWASTQHEFAEVEVCRHCLRTEADIEGTCHHCDEGTGARCWWCLKLKSASAQASDPPKTWIPTEGCSCYLCRAARLSPTPVSPVAPEPPTDPACKRCGHTLSAHRPEFGACDGSTRPCACPEFVQTTGAPAPCVWREMEDGEGKWRKTVMRTTCGLREDADEMRPLSQWPFCPQCGHPLTVER